MFDDKQIEVIKNWLGTGSVNIFGRPFAGKDNQCKRLVNLIGGHVVGGGEILRCVNLPEQAKQNISTGKLIPTEDFVNIVLPFLSQPEYANGPLFLSALGRWHGEEPGVVELLSKSSHPLKAVIYLNISNEDSYNRWLIRDVVKDRQDRNDDTEQVLKTRFAEFQEKTIPVIDYYRSLGVLIEIDGTKSRQDVTQDILDALVKLA